IRDIVDKDLPSTKRAVTVVNKDPHRVDVVGKNQVKIAVPVEVGCVNPCWIAARISRNAGPESTVRVAGKHGKMVLLIDTGITSNCDIHFSIVIEVSSRQNQR